MPHGDQAAANSMNFIINIQQNMKKIYLFLAAIVSFVGCSPKQPEFTRVVR